MKNRDEIAQALAASGYIADNELATAISLMQLLRRPLLLEGEAGVGKTEVAKALAAVHGTELIRLQCYEGLDQSASLYEWNYQRQLLSIQAHRGDNLDVDREARIIMARIDGAGASLSLQIARMVEGVRKEEWRKVPGVAETLDWAAALVGLDVRDLHDAPETVHETLMCLLKTHEDKSRVTREVSERLLGKVA